MEQRQKYIFSLLPKEQAKLFQVIENIIAHKRETLDIKQLRNKKWMYRLRDWNLRIIFVIINNEVKIRKIRPRGDVYK